MSDWMRCLLDKVTAAQSRMEADQFVREVLEYRIHSSCGEKSVSRGHGNACSTAQSTPYSGVKPYAGTSVSAAAVSPPIMLRSAPLTAGEAELRKRPPQLSQEFASYLLQLAQVVES